MSQHQDPAYQPDEHHNGKRRGMSRRQFLSYTLGGTGGFMAATMLTPMLRFAVDPLLRAKTEAEWVKIAKETDITEEPTSITFQVHVVDGWYESDPELTAWVSRSKDGKIFALSPVCKHLGCTVNWNGNPDLPNQYFCPCHGAHYTKDGKNLAVAPAPLDEFSVKVQDGNVYLGGLKSNTRV